LKHSRFDILAGNYQGGNEDPAKQMLTGSYENLVRLKLLLLRRIKKKVFGDRKIRVLDFGCGTGEIAFGLARDPGIQEVVGVDASAGMIQEATRRHQKGQKKIRWLCCKKGKMPAGKFDWILSVNTFHHIAPARRVLIAKKLRTLLSAGGVMAIMEHNPWNPLTRWVVSRCPFDRGVQLLSPSLTDRLIKNLGLEPQRYFSGFMPPHFFGSEFIEKLLSSLPLGVQYIAWGIDKSKKAQARKRK
jgi:SAM-dependent methyltransferase